MIDRRSLLAAAAAVSAFGIRRRSCRGHARRHRHRDQDRQHDLAQRTGLRARRAGALPGSLFPHDQRAGRRWRPADQVHLLRRRLQSREDRRAGAAPDRKRQCRLPVQHARHRAELGGGKVHQRPEGAAFVPVGERRQMGRLPDLSLDHGLCAERAYRGADLRQVRAEPEGGRKIRRALPERRSRQGFRRRVQGRARAQIRTRWRPWSRTR